MGITWTYTFAEYKPPIAISLGDFRIDALEARLEPAYGYADAYALHMSMRVPAVATEPARYAAYMAPAVKAGEIIPVHCSAIVAKSAIEATDRARFADMVKRELMRLLEHEIEEKLTIDGVYAFDPHGTRGRVPVPVPVPPKPAPDPKRKAKKSADRLNVPSERYPRSKRVAGKFPAQDLVVPKRRGTPWGQDLRGRL